MKTLAADEISLPEALPAIREAVHELLRAAGADSPPVDLARVGKVQGITAVRSSKLRSSLGLLHETRDGLRVTVNSREPAKSRFTLAHEIAHTFFLHSPHSSVVLGARKPRIAANKLERLCDAIAAEILMPYEMFLDSLDGREMGLDELLRLAGRFDASLQSVALRAGELSEQPFQALCWSKADAGHLKVTLASGRTYLAKNGDAAFRPLSDESSAAVRAYVGSERQEGVERPVLDAPWLEFRHEAQGFSKGERRFVLSVLTAIRN